MRDATLSKKAIFPSEIGYLEIMLHVVWAKKTACNINFQLLSTNEKSPQKIARAAAEAAHAAGLKLSFHYNF